VHKYSLEQKEKKGREGERQREQSFETLSIAVIVNISWGGERMQQSECRLVEVYNQE